MKNLLFVVLLFLLVAGCSDQYSVWAWGDEELGVRVGNIFDANRVEVGVSIVMQDDDNEPKSVGMYAIRYLPEVIQIPNPIVWEGLPKTLAGQPYFGLSVDRDCNEDTTSLSPIAGFIIEKFIFIGHNIDEQKTILGIKHDF
jgi:hypothetical protein